MLLYRNPAMVPKTILALKSAMKEEFLTSERTSNEKAHNCFGGIFCHPRLRAQRERRLRRRTRDDPRQLLNQVEHPLDGFL